MTALVDTVVPQAAIFDCDGILVDSEKPWLDLMATWLDRLGLPGIAPESFRGLSAAEAVDRFAELADSEAGAGPLPTVAEVDAAYSAALTQLSAPMPGAPELVAQMAGTIPLAVASNGHRDDVLGLLERAGLLGYFDAVVTIDDVDHGKPHPEAYLRAAQKLGIDASATAAFEDSRVGSQAADAAGCTVIGVNDDPAIDLVAAVRLTTMTQLRFDPAAGSLHILTAEGADR